MLSKLDDVYGSLGGIDMWAATREVDYQFLQFLPVAAFGEQVSMVISPCGLTSRHESHPPILSEGMLWGL